MQWHNIVDPASPELDRLAERYRLHPLHVEDCRHRRQNAKIEEGESYIFTVMKSVRVDGAGALQTNDVDIFLGPDFLITVLEGECPEIRALIEHVREAVTPEQPTDQVYYRVIDGIVDSYLPVL